jgi:hypothetical protein
VSDRTDKNYVCVDDVSQRKDDTRAIAGDAGDVVREGFNDRPKCGSVLRREKDRGGVPWGGEREGPGARVEVNEARLCGEGGRKQKENGDEADQFWGAVGCDVHGLLTTIIHTLISSDAFLDGLRVNAWCAGMISIVPAGVNSDFRRWSGRPLSVGRRMPLEVTSLELDTSNAWELLQRVVNSQELRRATRLRELLLYVGQRSLKSHAASIREQEIGSAVFGRPENYDTNIDNIVRVNVSELRKRLCHYFETEGAAEPVLMEIPRGGYLPVFVPRPAAEVFKAVEPVEHPPEPPREVTVTAEPQPIQPVIARSERNGRDLGTWLLWLLGSALLLALVAAAVFWWQARTLRNELQPWQADAGRAAFWGQFFASGEQMDIVTADTSYALAEDLLQRPISLDDYLDYEYKNYATMPNITPQTRDALNLVLNRNTGSVGDFEAAEQVLTLNGHSPLVRLASARSYTPSAIKSHNVVLIGSRQSNPWVELYKDRLNFYVEYDPARHRSYVANRAPLKGEQPVYEVVNDRNRDFSVIAFVPNLSEHRYALILAGTDSQGTRAAGEFIVSSEGVAAIRQRLPESSYPYFEVLLSSTRLEGTTLQTAIVAVRGYTK